MKSRIANEAKAVAGDIVRTILKWSLWLVGAGMLAGLCLGVYIGFKVGGVTTDEMPASDPTVYRPQASQNAVIRPVPAEVPVQKNLPAITVVHKDPAPQKITASSVPAKTVTPKEVTREPVDTFDARLAKLDGTMAELVMRTSALADQQVRVHPSVFLTVHVAVNDRAHHVDSTTGWCKRIDTDAAGKRIYAAAQRGAQGIVDVLVPCLD